MLSIFSSKIFAQAVLTVDGTSYLSIGMAVADLPNYEGQDVIIEIQAGTYNEILDISKAKTSSLTIKPIAQDIVNIDVTGMTGEMQNYALRIDSVNNFTLRGINFKNESTIYGGNLMFDNDGSGSGNHNVIIDSCTFTGLTGLGIDSTASIIYLTEGSAVNTMLISRCHFTGGSFGILSDSPFGTSSNNINIEDNIFENFGFAGISASRVGNLSIQENTFLSPNSASQKYGVQITESKYGLLINRNKFVLNSDVLNVAIDIDNNYDLYSKAIVINNMISLSGYGDNYGINIYEYSLGAYFNTFNIVGGTSMSAAIYIYKENEMLLADSLYNNIFNVDFMGDAIYFFSGLYDLKSNNNLFNIINGNFGTYNGTTCSSYDDWYNNPNSNNPDEFSIQDDPAFVAFDDLHVQNYMAVMGMGTYIPELNGLGDTDFDYDLRKNPPDIGADEVGSFLPTLVSSDTTWSGICFVEQPITIAAGATVTIDPDTKVIFNKNDSIVCHGNIMSLGTADKPIAFYSTSEPWAGISFDNSTNSNFEFTQFHYSVANYNGGAIRITSGNITFHYCQFENNYAALNGGAVYNDFASTYFTGCRFYSNSATMDGGAIYSQNQANTTVDNCIFAYNYATLNGGDIFVSDMVNAVDIVHSNFYMSDAMALGVNIYCNNSTVHVKNSLVSGATDSLIFKVPGSGFLGVYNTDINLGVDNIINADETLNIFNDDPLWVDPNNYDFHLLPESPIIDLGNADYIMSPYDAERKNRIYGPYPDLGAFEFSGVEMFAFAGNDTVICSTSLQLNANNPGDFEGTWSVDQGTGAFDDIHSFNTTVRNLAKTDNYLIWTVSNGFESVSDTIIVNNYKPVANAGDDITLISDDYPNPITQFELEIPNYSLVEEMAFMLCDSLDVLVEDLGFGLFYVSGLDRGEYMFEWTVYNMQDSLCSTTDHLLVTSGFSLYPSSKQRGLQWDDPTAWNVDGIPQKGDSVTIFGTDMHINDIDAECSNLVITGAGSLVLDGTGKAATNFRANRIFVEQDAEKYPNSDTAHLIITNGTIEIDSASGGVDDGLVVGSLGKVLIDASAGGVADIVMGKNRRLRVQEAAAFKTAKGNGEIIIRNGGRIFVEQDAEKSQIRGNDGIIMIGTGGRIFIEQDAEKALRANTSSIYVSRGGRIFVEQDAEKAVGGQITMRGGRIFVEQDAEKGADPSLYGLVIGNGGQVILNADATSDSSSVDVGRIQIYNGQLKVGTANKNRGGHNNVRANRIFVEQDAEKDFAQDTILFVGANGSVTISSTPNTRGVFTQNSKTAIHVADGGEFNVMDTSIFILNKGASFIDMNEENWIWGQQNFPFPADSILLCSTPFDFYDFNFVNQGIGMYWDESLDEFVDLTGGSMNAGNGYLFYNTGNSYTQQFWGVLNTGTVSAPVFASNSGVNLLGNPYPSAVDFDLLTINSNIQPTFYIYDFGTHNFKVHQTNGLSFTDEGSIIQANQGFFVFAVADAIFDFTNNARVHFYETNVVKNPSDYITFRVNDGIANDDLGLIFDNNADYNYNLNEDAVEFYTLEDESNSFYALTENNVPVAINAQPMPDSATVIPVRYLSNNQAEVTISLSENMLIGNNQMYLYDVETEVFHDLIAQPDYTFTYDNTGVAKEMLITFLPYFTNLDDVSNNNNVKIYSFNNNVYVNSFNSNIQNVEIYSITGVKLFDQEFNNREAVINTNVTPGIYIIKAVCGDNIYTSKVVLK